MLRSSLSSAPTIICVLWPAGAKRGGRAGRGAAPGITRIGASPVVAPVDPTDDPPVDPSADARASRASSMCSRSRPIERWIALVSFSGASCFRPASVGISTLMLSRSAYRPARRSSSSLASGMVLRWM